MADTSINSPPIAVNDNATTAAKTTVIIAVLANDTDANDDALSQSALNLLVVQYTLLYL